MDISLSSEKMLLKDAKRIRVVYTDNPLSSHAGIYRPLVQQRKNPGTKSKFNISS